MDHHLPSSSNNKPMEKPPPQDHPLLPPPPQQVLKCPRCDSSNTKFCYYNNYSLTQPRHFCKTCRRYWTKGGALRSVPIGGGCRKNKKMKSSISPRVSENSKDSNGSSSNISGLKFFQGISPAMDFQLQPPSSSTSGGLFNQFPSNPCLNQVEMGLINFPFSSAPLLGFQEIGSLNGIHHHHQGQGNNNNNNLASSIESLSSMNQELHWKLQQQRLAMLFVGDNNQKENNNNASDQSCVIQKPQPILFQNLEISKPSDHDHHHQATSYNNNNQQVIRKESGTNGNGSNLATEWYFDGTSFGGVNPTPSTPVGNLNDNTTAWNGLQAWTGLAQYNDALP